MSDLFATAATDLALLLQSLLALALGGAIGWERETAGKGAGLRTNMLVCLGAFLFVRVGLLIPAPALASLPDEGLRMDPLRLIEAVATGIAFLGAGMIFRDREHNGMHGYTTAATLLTVAPIGIAVAVGHYVLAVGVTALVVGVLRLVHRFEDRVLDS
jgi:putative Mg2+ transporter-C (MgtC) family protein